MSSSDVFMMSNHHTVHLTGVSIALQYLRFQVNSIVGPVNLCIQLSELNVLLNGVRVDFS